jgi:hypothetical protein
MDSVCPNEQSGIGNLDLQSRHKLNLNMLVTDLLGFQQLRQFSQVDDIAPSQVLQEHCLFQPEPSEIVRPKLQDFEEEEKRHSSEPVQVVQKFDIKHLKAEIWRTMQH